MNTSFLAVPIRVEALVVSAGAYSVAAAQTRFDQLPYTEILTAEGEWVTPILLAIIDDRSRVICHAQWYLGETAEILD